MADKAYFYFYFIFIFIFFLFSGVLFWGEVQINTPAPKQKSKSKSNSNKSKKMPLPATQPIAIPRRRQPSAKPTDATAAEVHVPDPWIPGPRCIASSRPEPSPPARERSCAAPLRGVAQGTVKKSDGDPPRADKGCGRKAALCTLNFTKTLDGEGSPVLRPETLTQNGVLAKSQPANALRDRLRRAADERVLNEDSEPWRHPGSRA